MEHRQVNEKFNIVVGSLVFGIVAALCAGMVVHDQYQRHLKEISQWTMVVVAAIATVAIIVSIAVGIAVICGLCWLLWLAYEHGMSKRAQRLLVQRESDVYAIVSEFGVYVREMNSRAVWKDLTLNPAVWVNGKTQPVTPEEEERWRYFHAVRNQPKATKELLAPVASPVMAPEKPNLLDIAIRRDRLMLIGGSGSGKTTFMQHMVANKEGDVIVCDPDDDRDTWPSNAVVIGGGEDWRAIENELMSFVAEKKRRYQARANGEKIFPPVYLVLDEWYKTIQYIEGGKYLKEMLISLRKVNMGVMVVSQSDRASALGLSGNFDLMSSFEAVVRLSGNRETGIIATVQLEGRPDLVEAIHPGPFNNQRIIGSASRPYEVIDVPIAESSEEDRIVSLFHEGHKPWKIGEIIYGSKGGWQTGNVETVLRKRGLI